MKYDIYIKRIKDIMYFEKLLSTLFLVNLVYAGSQVNIYSDTNCKNFLYSAYVDEMTPGVCNYGGNYGQGNSVIGFNWDNGDLLKISSSGNCNGNSQSQLTISGNTNGCNRVRLSIYSTMKCTGWGTGYTQCL
jgi:hypothetical protein